MVIHQKAMLGNDKLNDGLVNHFDGEIRRVIGPGGARTICGVQFIIPVESQVDVGSNFSLWLPPSVEVVPEAVPTGRTLRFGTAPPPQEESR